MPWVSVLLILSVIALVLSLVLITVVTRYFWKGYPRKTSSEVCPSCTYPRKGLESPTCPECGTRWGEAKQLRTPWWIELSLITVFLLILFLVLPGVLILFFAVFGG